MRFSTRAWRPAAADALLVAFTWLLAFLFRFSLLRNDAPANLAQILWISTPLAAAVWVAALAGWAFTARRGGTPACPSSSGWPRP
jgi:hypothetical protein